VVATHGRSFWICDDIAPLRDLAAKKSGMLLKPASAYRVRRSNYTDTPVPPDEPMGENPPDGAPIDYSLPDNVTGPVTLEILDKSGAVLRRYSSSDPVKPNDEELHKDLIPAYWPLITGPLPASAGMHRWIWDLRAAMPMAGRYGYPISAVPHRTPKTPQGPFVTAGAYTVRLTVNGKSETETITVKMDPRVHTSAADLEKLHAEQVKMASALDSMSKADLAAHAITEQLAKPENKSVAGIEPFVARLKTLTTGAEGKSGPDSKTAGLDDIAGEAATVYTQLDQSDEPPTAALLAAAAHAADEAREALPKWKAFVAKDLPDLNKILKQANRPEIDESKEPDDMPDFGDED
jgi:hypothetical protein